MSRLVGTNYYMHLYFILKLSFFKCCLLPVEGHGLDPVHKDK